MNSSVTKRFRAEFAGLDTATQAAAIRSYRLWLKAPQHPSLHFKRIGGYWSVRIGLSHRALAREKAGTFYWFWIGHHKVYERLIKGH
jgi:hypothetical protein